MVWMFAYPAFIKFPGLELRDFYPVFSIFNSWMGLIILIFLGLSSKRFRHVLSVACKRKVIVVRDLGINNLKLGIFQEKPASSKYVQSSTPVAEDECPIVPLEVSPDSSPRPSRPSSSRPLSGSPDMLIKTNFNNRLC